MGTIWATTPFKFPIRKRVVAKTAFFYPLYISLAFAGFTFFDCFNFLADQSRYNGSLLYTYKTSTNCVIH
jgi:hypothetical protein